MGNKKKFIKGDLVSCMLCLEKHNKVYDLNKKLTDTIDELLNIKVENVIKLPKRLCYRCYFIVEYFCDYRNVTIRNVTVAENKLTEDNSSITYDRPLIFNIITEKVLKEENIPYNLDVAEYITEEIENRDSLIVPQSYRDVSSVYEHDVLPYKQTIFQCKYCTITYNKKTSLVHHERKHKRQMRRERCRSASSNRSKNYTCDECDNETVFNTVTELRKHRKSHTTSITCRMGCGIKFNASVERQFHEAVCNIDLEKPGVRTRSRSRLASVSRSRGSSIESYRSFGRSGWSSQFRSGSDSSDTWDSVSTNNKSKQMSHYTEESCNTYDSSCSTIMTGTNTQRSLANSTRNESFRSEPVNVRTRPGRTRKGSNLTKESESGKYTQESVRNDFHPAGFQPRTTVESIFYLKNYRKPTESTKKHQCRHCKYSNYNVDTVSIHENKKHNIQPWFICYECRKTFTNQQFLDRHKSEEHRQGPFQCAVCSEVHSSQHNLQLHLRNHRYSHNEECSACDKKFLTLEQLKIHIDGETDRRHSIYKLPATNNSYDTEHELNSDTQLDLSLQINEVFSLTSCSSRPSTPFPNYDDDQLSFDFSNIDSESEYMEDNTVQDDDSIEVHEHLQDIAS